MRHTNPALRRGSFQPLYSNEDIFAFGRKLEKETLIIALNSGELEYNLNFAVDVLELPQGPLDTIFGNAIGVIQNGQVSGLKVAPRSAVVLKRPGV